jgi:hypothetical protein
MADQEWDAMEFFQRFQNGEFDGQLGEALDSLSPEQMEELKHYLLVEGESRQDIIP